MDITLIQKKQTQPFFGGGRTFLKIIPFYLILAAAYGGLYYYEQKLAVQKNGLDAEIQKIIEERKIGTEEKMILLDKQLKNLGSLLGNHVYMSRALALLEETAHPKVQFKSFSVSADKATMDLSAGAETYLSLAKQIVNFQSSPDILKSEISGININPDGKVDFKAVLDLKPETLKYKAIQK